MAKASNSQESFTSSDDDDDHGFVYHRSRGRTRKEDSWLRKYRKKMRNGSRSPESEERRSLSPYTCVAKKFTKPKKQKKKKKSKKTESETQKSSKDSISIRASDSKKEDCPIEVPLQRLELT